MKTLQSGFTLIEVVVVITILGILAAFAIPRFVSLEGEARVAAAQALAGSIRSGASLAHALWLAEGDPSSTSVMMEGQAIEIWNGYPSAATIDGTLVEHAGFALATSNDAAIFTKVSSSGTPIAGCFVTYRPAPAPNDAPAIVATTTGC